MSSASKRERSIGRAVLPSLLPVVLGFTALPLVGVPFHFRTSNSDGLIATETRPVSLGKFEIEFGFSSRLFRHEDALNHSGRRRHKPLGHV
jgi:hypothetical protein